MWDLTSVEDDFPFDPATDEASPMGAACSLVSMLNCFLEVICFFYIVGLVIQELCRPSQIDLFPDQMLYAASVFDQCLTGWKMILSRHLRFELGHIYLFKRHVWCLSPHTSFHLSILCG